MTIEASILTRDGRHVVIRSAQVEDATALVQAVDAVAQEGRWFLKSSFTMSVDAETEYIASLPPQEGALIVAAMDAVVVGWLTINRGGSEYAAHTAEIGMGIVQPYRDIGIGTALLESAVVWAKNAGIEKLCLGVRATSQRARRLYTRMGFVEGIADARSRPQRATTMMS